MTIAVAVFAPDDLAAMTVQSAQTELQAIDRRAHGRAIAAGGRAFTARRVSDGEVLFCGGAIAAGPGYATLWAALSPEAGPAMLALTRRVRRFVATLDERRIDTIVRAGCAPHRRWVERLGFVYEATLGEALNGADAIIYRWPPAAGGDRAAAGEEG